MPPDQRSRVRGHGEGLGAPVGVQPEQRPDAERAHARLGAAVGSSQPPVVVALLPLQMDCRVRVTVVGLLVHDEPLAAGLGQPPVGRPVPHLHLDRDRRDLWLEDAHALDQVVLAHDAGVLS